MYFHQFNFDLMQNLIYGIGIVYSYLRYVILFVCQLCLSKQPPEKSPSKTNLSQMEQT